MFDIAHIIIMKCNFISFLLSKQSTNIENKTCSKSGKVTTLLLLNAVTFCFAFEMSWVLSFLPFTSCELNDLPLTCERMQGLNSYFSCAEMFLEPTAVLPF